ncbi:MAG: DNA recombination protein RmuC [Bacteroidetes bacterium]|nr:MAG: DNA recombination protein RmuC [Bacteroidota bacterium]
MEIITVILMAGVLLLLILLLFRQSPNAQTDYSSSMQMMQQQVESLRSDMRSSMQLVTENLNQQLHGIAQQMQTQTANVGSRLDAATRVIGDVQRNLGELGKATQEIKELGQGVSTLEELLRAPKLRGGLGELLLEDLLRQVLPAEHVLIQHRFNNGQTVDAAIRTSDRLVCVDSKFPLENFRKLYAGVSDAEKKQFRKIFFNDVKKHIDAIAGKYILPDEGTYPFALMYIPAENIYYEVIIKGNEDNGENVYSYAIEKKVIPVSPNSFYAYLQVIVLGLRGLQIEHSAQEIVSSLTRLQGDMEKVRDTFETLGVHLNNARNKYDEADKRLNAFERRLDGIAGRPGLDVHHEPKLQIL